MLIGASFGRMVGILVQALHKAYLASVFCSTFAPDVPCITPGTYIFLGAAAALSGIMLMELRISWTSVGGLILHQVNQHQ
jgi:chloride channel 3/4/5